jgi:hypothetical protein
MRRSSEILDVQEPVALFDEIDLAEMDDVSGGCMNCGCANSANSANSGSNQLTALLPLLLANQNNRRR